MWRRLKLLARAWFRRVQVGVVLERLGSRPGDNGEPDTIRAVAGSSIVTLVGQPSELMLYAHGRTRWPRSSWSASRRPSSILNAADLRTLSARLACDSARLRAAAGACRSEEPPKPVDLAVP